MIFFINIHKGYRFRKKGGVLQKVIVDVFWQFNGKMPKVISFVCLPSIKLLDGISLIRIMCIYYAVVV